MPDIIGSLRSLILPRRHTNDRYWTDCLVLISRYDLANPAAISEIEHILSEGAARGLTGVVVSGAGEQLPGAGRGYLAGLDRIVAACRRLRLELIPSGFSPGDSTPFLGVNRHLAEGLPVIEAPFLAGSAGKADLTPDPLVSIQNGGFENHKGNVFEGYSYQARPGSVSFADIKVFHSGHCSLRLENFANDPWGHARVVQVVPVHPYRCYRISLWLKTEGMSGRTVFRMELHAPTEGGRMLQKRDYFVPGTGEWQKLSLVLNSAEFEKLILTAGIWEGNRGRAWMDDLAIEELGPLHVIRRPGTPVSVTNEEGNIAYREGRDFARLEDPNMNFLDEESPSPPLRLVPEGRIKPGDRLKVSWYHPFAVIQDKIGVCLSEEEVFDIIETRARKSIEHLHPRRFFLDFGIIAIAATCGKCAGKSPAALVGKSAARAIEIIKRIDPAIEIMMWSDMFDPHENAREEYFYVKGSLANSWKHIPRDVIMVPHRWRVNPASLDFLHAQGFPVVGSLFEDYSGIEEIKEWILTARRYRNVRGLMFTSWQKLYDMVPRFCDLMKP